MAVLKYRDPDTGEFKSLDLGSIEIIDNLDSSQTDSALSANQGRVLNEKFANYLELSGGTITGDLTVDRQIYMNGNKVLSFVVTDSWE